MTASVPRGTPAEPRVVAARLCTPATGSVGAPPWP